MNYKKLTATTPLFTPSIVAIFWTSMIIIPSPPEKQNENKIMPPNCSDEKMDLIRAKPTSEEDAFIKIDCNCNLTSNDIITKRLILEGHAANNVVINGNGATVDGGPGNKYNAGLDMIQVKSRSFLDGTIRKWERPENVTVKNFNIIGSVRIWGMTTNGEGKEYEDYNGRMVNYYKNSSRTAGHVATARNNAPKNITLNNITITGTGRIPLYFSPGVSYSKLINSEIKGNSTSVGIYLDAESSHNEIKRNYIHPVTESRELIAVDGSSYNQITCNNFSSLNNGGINFYRNCGEEGVIRHSTPLHNSILNNLFYYNLYTGNNGSVHLGSRNADSPGLGSYCNEDDGYPYGSSASNYDYAKENVIMGNQICKRSVTDMIKTTNPALNSPNYIGHNETVNCEDIRLGDRITRRAGCYVQEVYRTDFIADGESTDLFKTTSGRPINWGLTLTCNDGEIIKKITPDSKPVKKYSFECHVSGNNSGCTRTISCGQGERIIGVTGASDLETGNVSDDALNLLPTNTFKVVRASDFVSEGWTIIGSNIIRSGQTIINNVYGLNSIQIGCRENDSNGGDCQIKVFLYCR